MRTIQLCIASDAIRGATRRLSLNGLINLTNVKLVLSFVFHVIGSLV